MANDWTKPVGSFLYTFQQDGWEVLDVSDGGDKCYHPKVKEAVEFITAVDDSVVSIKKGNIFAKLYISLMNDPEEIVYDYSCVAVDNNEDPDDYVENTLDKYIQKWEGKKCPRKQD